MKIPVKKLIIFGVLKKILMIAVIMIINTDTAKAGNLDIAVLINNIANPYWQVINQGIEDSAKELNINIHVQSLSSDGAAEQQLNQCETSLLKQPKALIFAAVNGVNLGSCLKKAHEQNILLIDLDGNMDQELAKDMGVKIAFSVASNNYDLGKKAAEYIDDKSGKVLIIEGIEGSEPSKLRVNGFKENINENIKIVSLQSGKWDRLRAADITNNVMMSHPDLKIIFACNDTMALGAVEALRSKNINNVMVVGVDGTSDAVKAINSGKLDASIAQLPYLMAKQAVEKTYNHINNNKEYEFNQNVPVMVLDKEVISNNKDPLLEYVR